MKKQHRISRLEVSLATYASSAKAMCGRAGNWATYAAVTGSALAMATSASAAIITSIPETPITVTPGTGASFVHLPGLLSPQATVEHFPAVLGRVAAGMDGSVLETGFSHLAPFLGSGVLIGPNAAGSFVGGGAPALRSVSDGVPIAEGDWPAAGGTGFLGFRFITDTHFNYDYGWMKLSFSVDANGLPDSLTFYGLAYDDTNAPILTGDTGAPEGGGTTPEPGTAGLMLLALGAAAVGVLRKQKATPVA